MTTLVDPGSAEARMREALLTMDVVDQLRHNEAALAALAANDEASLKRRLAEIYRSQGIEVTDEVLDAGIKAQRDKRFVHTPYTGPWLGIARLWINRRAVLRATTRIAAIAAVLSATFFFGYWAPKEARIDRALNDANGIILPVRELLSEAEADLAARVARFYETAASINSDRLIPAKLKLSAEVDAIAYELPPQIRATLATAPGKLDRDAWQGKAETASLAQNLDREWLAIQGRLSDIDRAAEDLSRFSMLEQQMLLSNQELLARQLRPDIDRTRAAAFDAGVAALAAVDLADTQKQALNLAGFVAAFAELAEIGPRVEALYARGMATRPTPDAVEVLDRQKGAILAAATPTSIDKARDALDALRSTVDALALSYRFRIVSRPGQQSGVWRYSDDSPNSRNYYLVIEALDAAGNRVSLPITNEETGRRKEVTTFAVRVTEAEYERVKRDKLDNGLIDQPWVGAKDRGALEPTFSVDKVGGYITQW